MKNHLNTNKQFMIGNGILAFAVFAVIIIFLYMSFRFKRDAEHVKRLEGVYCIELTSDFKGDSVHLYINDSLICAKNMLDEDLQFSVQRFADESVLMVVNAVTEQMNMFDLDKNGCNMKIRKDGDVVYLQNVSAK